MSKKSLLVSVLAAIIGSISLQSPPTFATESKQIWTIPQLITLKSETDQEIENICAGDMKCEESIRFSRLDAGVSEYIAVDSFSNMILLVTAINPSNSTVRVLFHDEDPMMRMMGVSERAILDELHIAWFSKSPTMYNVDYVKHGNYPADTYHPLFAGSAAKNGANWLAPNIEVELNINDAESLYSSPYLIHFTMDADITNVSGAHDYSDCMTSPAYEEGMECRMVFDENGWFYFLPFWPGAEAPATVTSVEETPAPATDTSEPASDITTTNDSSTEDVSADDGYGFADSEEVQATESSTEVSSDAASDENISNLVIAPNTGEFTSIGFHAKKTDLPWWIAGLLIANLILLVWWFLPIRQKPSKNSKISKKSVDKKGRLR